MNDPLPGPVTPPAGSTDPNETALRGLEPTGSQPVVEPSATDQPTVAGSRHPAGAHNLPSIVGYSVVQQVGEGGMGAVYLAEDAKLGRKVAIKTMKPELAASQADRDRFAREARAAAAVEHENIVPIWGIGEASDGTPFIAMPFLQGEMLDGRLKRQSVAQLALILKVAREVADGLAAAHAKGLIHRDIKPGNIWLEGDLASREPRQQLRRCRILDFGLARSVAASDAQITTSGVVLGTPAYMAPEQAHGKKVDHRADLFSLGVTLYRMATGKLPFNGPTAMAVLIALTTETPAPVSTLNPNLPPALADLIDRLICKDPAGRPQSAAEVSATAQQIAENFQSRQSSPESATPVQVVTLPNAADSSSLPQVLPVLAGEATETVPVTRPRRKLREKPKPGRWLLLARVVVGLLMLASVGAWLATRGAKPETTVAQTKDEDPPQELAKPDPTVTRKKDEAPPKAETRLDTDRKAAEYVLSIGGSVVVVDDSVVQGLSLTIRDRDELPKGPFRLTGVQLGGNKQVTDADLAVFTDCVHVTDLHLYATAVTNTGLAHFQNCKNLAQFYLDNTSIGDAGLAHFAGRDNIIVLMLSSTKVTDIGLGFFKDCKKLTQIALVETQVGDAGLTHVKGCPQLEVLHASGTLVGDLGLAHIHDCKRLTYCTLAKTKVTTKGINALARALPLCAIEWNGGSIAAASDADRKAAEYVHSINGAVRINGDDKELGSATKLPKEPFRLTGVFLRSNERITPAGLAAFKDCKNVTYLGLSGARVTDAGLVHFAGCRNLTSLDLSLTGVSDTGLAVFKDCKKLTDVYLQRTGVTDATLAQLKECKGLIVIYLDNTKITDEGLAHLHECKALQNLFLKGTKVTQTGIDAAKKALPGCKIEWDKGVIPPTK